MARARRRPGDPKPRRPFWLSPEEQEAALVSLAFGVPAEGIAAAYHTDGGTLVRYLTPQRVAAKRAEMDGRLARSLYHKAMVQNDTTTQIFLSKARLGYRDGWGERAVRGEDEGAPRVVVTGGLPEPEKP